MQALGVLPGETAGRAKGKGLRWSTLSLITEIQYV